LEASCQRCHEAIRADDRYCPVCGLPQLTYEATEMPETVPADDATPGVAREPFGLAGGIAWRPALRVAMMLAVPAGFLWMSILPIGLLGVAGTAAWAVALYARRTRTSRMPTGAGARIGMVMGLMAGWLTMSLVGIQLWVSRFVLHQGGQMDSLQTALLEDSLVKNQQIWTQMGLATAQVAQNEQMWRSWLMSTEGRAGTILFPILASVAVLVAIASLGGAAGARFLAQQRRPNA
jgi:hypothetical protein